MFSSKQTHMFNYFICYHLESGWHVTRPNQGFSLGRGREWERGCSKTSKNQLRWFLTSVNVSELFRSRPMISS